MNGAAADFRGCSRTGRFACWRDKSGSLLLESSLTLPWIAVSVFALMLFALFVSQGALLYYKAAIATERAAFNWSNSARELRTGAVPAGRYDDLYWRLTDDRLLGGLLGLGSGEARTEASVEIGSSLPQANEGGAVYKLFRAGEPLADAYAGELRYANRALAREVTAEVGGSWLPAALVVLRGGNVAAAKVSAPVSDPAELVRSVDLVRYYAAKMRLSSGGAADYREKAKSALAAKTGK